VQRIGAPRPIAIDFRLVATTNRNLADAVRAGEFREDLYYRLNVLPVPLKPLRERVGDLDVLIDRFLARSLPAPILPEGTRAALRAHTWPGNVRELENAMARLCLTHPGRVVQPHELGLSDRTRPAPFATDMPTELPPTGTLRDMERWLIVRTLARLEGNRTRAAREHGISLRTLRNKINEYYISEPETLPRSGTGPRALRPTAGRI
jgi:two-component system response regulator FlrC